MVEIVDETMALAARMHAVETGSALSDHAMVAFGGAAPLHAARLCAKLGIGRLLVPVGAGVGSAIGFLDAPASFEATRSALMALDAFDGARARAIVAALAAEAEAFVRACGPDAPTAATLKLHMRYRGQGWDVPVEAAADDLDPDAIGAAFEAAYRALFGRTVAGMVPEITIWSVTVTAPVPEPEPLPPAPSASRAPSRGARPLVDPADGTRSEATLYRRDALAPGAAGHGPALVTERETTIVVPRGHGFRVLADGTIEIRPEAAP